MVVMRFSTNWDGVRLRQYGWQKTNCRSIFYFILVVLIDSINDSANRNVSIKVLVARKTNDSSYAELRILTHLTGSSLEHPGKRHIPKLIDHFYVEGPNGLHLCLVMDILGPTAWHVQYELSGNIVCMPPKIRHLISRQLLLAVDYLHQCGIAHGG